MAVGCSSQSSSETQKTPKDAIADAERGTFTTLISDRDSAVTKAAVWIVFKESWGGSHQCTGTLFNQGQIVTAKHCNVDCQTATLSYWDGTAVKTAKCDSKKDHSSADLSIITSSDNDLLAKGTPFKFDYSKVSPSKDEKILVYYFDSSGNLKESSDCKIVSVDKKYFGHNCTTNSGASGALIVKESDGLTVVGIHKGNGTEYNISTKPVIGLHSEEESDRPETNE